MSASLAIGQAVRECDARVPKRCQPFTGKVHAIAPDGWVMVSLDPPGRLAAPTGPRVLSFPPGEWVAVTS